MLQSRSRALRILVFLGILTLAHIALFLYFGNDLELLPFSEYFENDRQQVVDQEHGESAPLAPAASSVTAYSHITQQDAQRIGTFWSSSNQGLPQPVLFNPVNTSSITTCEGPPVNLTGSRSAAPYPAIYAYPSLPSEFPLPAIGSHQVIGTNGGVCFTPTSRYGPYGVRNKEAEWPSVKWGDLQQKCLERNKHIYSTDGGSTETGEKARQAVVLRGYDGFKWRPNDIHYTRSLVAELSLASGGEYEVILLVELTSHEHANLTTLDLQNPSIIQSMAERYIPSEFRSLAIFFNTNILQDLYPDVGEYSYVMQAYQPIQWLALLHLQFSYFWTIEQDFRYTGHNYEFFDAIGKWAKDQPRKGAWERSSQFYIPAVHRTWDAFSQLIKVSTPAGKGVFGPQVPMREGFEPEMPLPNPISENWGVGEDADVISLSPIWDPAGSGWVFEDIGLKGYPSSTPRRASPPSGGRFSRRVLMLSHREQVEHGTFLTGESTNPTIALHHGLKAVYAPHPIYLDEDIDHGALARVFNFMRPGGRFDVTTARVGSLTTKEWKDRWQRLSFSWNNLLGGELYRWWVGSEIVDEGRDRSVLDGYEPCFPSMALHPVKDV